jgi:hypothetical protein
MEARIIKLSPESNISRVATFEEAFGEFSEARGRGRARRQRRRMERIENRAERRSAKRQSRAQAQAERQAIRSERQAGRQANRMQRKSSRLERRMMGAEARAERKKLRNPEEELTDENNLPPVGNEQAPPEGYGQSVNALPPSETQGGYSDGGQGGGSYGDESKGGGYADEEGDGNYQSEDGGYEGDSEDAGEETDEQGSDSENESDYGFDGIISAEDRFGDVAGDDNIQRVVVNPTIQDMANKYEWNKELACRLIMKRNDANNSGMATSGLTDQIEERKNRMAEIKANFDNYLNFDADFSECCGYSSADGMRSFKRANPKLKRKRSMEVKKALETSRNNRMSVKGGSAMDKLRKADKIRHYGGDVVPVEEGLNPEFSQNQIVVPSEVKSNFTGLNGIDNANDFDAPPTREFFLNADGEGQGAFIGVGSLLLGVGITIGILYLVDKYKVIK